MDKFGLTGVRSGTRKKLYINGISVNGTPVLAPLNNPLTNGTLLPVEL